MIKSKHNAAVQKEWKYVYWFGVKCKMSKNKGF